MNIEKLHENCVVKTTFYFHKYNSKVLIRSVLIVDIDSFRVFWRETNNVIISPMAPKVSRYLWFYQSYFESIFSLSELLKQRAQVLLKSYTDQSWFQGIFNDKSNHNQKSLLHEFYASHSSQSYTIALEHDFLPLCMCSTLQKYSIYFTTKIFTTCDYFHENCDYDFNSS